MYINVKKHILSNAILSVAIVKIIAAITEGSIRIFLNNNSSDSPTMLDSILWTCQIISSLIQIFFIIIIFYLSWKKLWHYMNLVPKEDQKEMALLQQEYLGKRLATLSAASVSRLLQLWAVIFICAELIYDFSSIMYRRFIAILMSVFDQDSTLSDSTFILLYNLTHGFKYLEILVAILLGIVMTGIFLNDKYLKLASLVILILFLLSFSILQMQTVYLLGREIGIVWTSIIYHFTETLGLILLSAYLSKRYKGL
ncbi:hypothetical protein [Butyrivibrio sp.]|uniref:hypothetical protein n=1 Tax=Butyrivibrio sp. TaxID=28121 RepID=UPI0025C66EBF|nr:hypothetical protein [Butyrivibrio sp.]